jgi:hypothetical protein
MTIYVDPRPVFLTFSLNTMDVLISNSTSFLSFQISATVKIETQDIK